MKHLNLFLFSVLLCFASQAQNTIKYVKPNAPSNGNGDLTTTPYNDIAFAVNKVKQAGGGKVVVIDGTYNMGNQGVEINTVATASTKVTIEPQTPGQVKLKFTGRFGFDFTKTSRYITLKGIELYGQTDSVDYWDIVAKAFWGDSSIPRNGGIAILLNGRHITIEDCYIHDWYQKAVEIKDGRYVNIYGNIIHDIATTSLSGGHGIMRQQKGEEYGDDATDGSGNLLYYRWDIAKNLLFSIEQRIYSWVPKKGFIEMTIDEGKPILIDDPKNTDGHQENMKARIKNNVVAYGNIDALRLKSTPNLEVSNNSIYQTGPNADGITTKQSDKTGANKILFTGFKCTNNAVETDATVFAFDLKKADDQTGNTADISGNHSMNGKVKPSNHSGLTKHTGSDMFVNPTAGDFHIKSSLNLPSSLGVETTVLNNLDTKKTQYGVTVAPSNTFTQDNLKLSQTIFDNIPLVDDGIQGNETVFDDHGTVHLGGAEPHFLYNVVNGPWKTDKESPNTQEFKLNSEYLAWYNSVKAAHPGYNRYRWGSSEIMQNHVFPSNWLTVTQINGLNDHTSINGHDKKLTLGGDILIDFEGYTPSVGDNFDLMVANQIVPESTPGNAFNNILFEGYTPTNYTLTVVQDGGNDVLRLAITAPLAIDNQTLNTTTLKVVPNPTNGAFVLETKNAVKHIKLYDVLGREVTHNTTITPVTNGYKFNVTQLAKGIYILKADQQSIKVLVK